MSNQQPIKITSFTSRYSGLSRELVNEVSVSNKIFHPTECQVDINSINAHTYKALWDTGATNCVITQKIIDDLNLKPIGMTRVNTASHTAIDAEVFLVSILLPNKMCIPNVRVTKGNIAGHSMLIGMDIIGLGDFAVTHHNGKTTFSFRMPSISEIDFTNQSNLINHSHLSKIPRNNPCPCGSGKKYKKCCGKV